MPRAQRAAIVHDIEWKIKERIKEKERLCRFCLNNAACRRHAMLDRASPITTISANEVEILTNSNVIS